MGMVLRMSVAMPVAIDGVVASAAGSGEGCRRTSVEKVRDRARRVVGIARIAGDAGALQAARESVADAGGDQNLYLGERMVGSECVAMEHLLG